MRLLLLLPLLLLLTSCGGGRIGTDAPVNLSYADPDSGAWRLVKDPSSSGDRLVLALVGPSGLKTRGAAITLLADERLVRFLTFEDGAYVQSTGVYATTNTGRPQESKILQLIVGGASGGKFTAGVFQKDPLEPAQESGQPLLRIVLAAQPGLSSGTALPLLLRKATYLPDDLAAANHKPVPMVIALGKLAVS